MSNFGFDLPPPDLSNPSPSPESWLESKRLADSRHGAAYSPAASSPTWRIHDQLYDFTEFLPLHPGGPDWLILSRGTDITELFESHHPNIEKARSLLKKYQLKLSSSLPPRNSGTFSFKTGGFYDTLRTRAWRGVLQYSGTGPTWAMLVFHTTLLLLFLTLLFSASAIAGQSDPMSDKVTWLGTASLAGVVLALLMMCSHNFFHQKDNWRMYVFDLSPFSSYDWRITHAYSHHTFPNTSFDYEVSTTANILNFYPYDFPSLKFVTNEESGIRVVVKRVIQIILLQAIFLLAMNLAFLRKITLLLSGGSTFRREDLLPVILYVGLVLCYSLSFTWPQITSCGETTGYDFIYSCWSMYKSVIVKKTLAEMLAVPSYILVSCYAVTSWTFMTISLATGHHHPDCWHDGDAFHTSVAKRDIHPGDTLSSIHESKRKKLEIDWGLFQLAAVGDRPIIDTSMTLSAVSFGRHTLHHLFPTVDHSKLDLLLPIFAKTCEDFGVRFFSPSSTTQQQALEDNDTQPTEKTRCFTPYESWIGMWQQLWRDSPSDRSYIGWNHQN